MSTEIERKFLLDAWPAVEVRGVGEQLRQGYLAEDGDVSVRVRITETAAVLTVKAGQGLSRTEVEVEISAGEANELWALTDGRRIEKVRHRLAVEGAVAELDLYADSLDGLATVEVEFSSVNDANEFRPPPWFGREVTDDVRWTNAALARHGRPD